MKKRLLSIVLVLVFVSLRVFSQEKLVTGVVTSAEDKQPLPGASIKVKGTSLGTTSGSNGSFSIRANSNQVLVISFVGTQAVEIPVGDGGVKNVSLKSESGALKEVVVTTAYGIQRSAASLGYSTPTVKGDEVTQTGRENFINGLAGRVPGLSVNQTSGDPGASSQIVLRGFVSISGDNSPLMVVDGVPIDNSVVNQLNTAMNGTNQRQDYTNRAADINPADIDTYTILKGPEATALYGNLGASGAIVITTKKGKAGRASVSYNSSLRIETVNNAPTVQQVYGQGAALSVSDGTSFNFFGPKYAEGLRIYDNIESFFETGIAQKHNIVFEGGKDSFTYRWSNEYTDNKGTIPTTQYKRLVSSLTGSAALSSKVSLTTRFSYTNAYNKKANKGSNGYLLGLLRFPSRYDVTNWVDEFGNRVTTTGTVTSELDNPFWDLNKNLAEDKTHSLFANTTFTVKPTKWLNLTAIAGTNISNTDGLVVYHKQSLASGTATNPTGGVVNTSQTLNRRYDASLTASARHTFGKFNNTYVVGVNYSSVNNTINSARGQNMFDPDFYSINNTLPSTQTAKLYVNRYRNGGLFGQAILGYESLLYLTLTGRVDAASRLMPNNPYFAYPSASLAFNFRELDAVKNLDWLSYGKLRGSYGVTGKEPYQAYALATRLLPVNSTGGGFNYDLANGGNDTLEPERTYNFETGFELGFFKDRIGVDFTYYRLLSKGQIVLPRISYGSGFVLRMMNGGEVLNRGVEIQLKGSPIRNKNLTWNMTFNFTRNKGIINSIAEDLSEYYNDNTWLGNGLRGSAFPGASTMSLGGWVYDRNKNGDLLINPATGLPLLKGGGADYYEVGDRAPKFNLGFNNDFRYKSFGLRFLFDLRYGGDVYNGTEYDLYVRGLSLKTLDRETPRVITGVLKDGFENSDNPTANNIVVTPATNTNYYTSTTNGVANETFVEKNIKALRLRDVTFSYDLPNTVSQKIRFIQSAGLFLTLTDVFLITNYSGMDPDINGNNPSVGGVGGYGIDYGGMGRPLGVNLGLRLKL